MKMIGILMIAALPSLALATHDGHGDHEKGRKDTSIEIGKPAPDFELKDFDGKTVKLSDYKGKTVVLEWFNPECPFVVYAHTKGNLKGMDEATAKDGVVWLAINSGAPGVHGTGAEANNKMRKEWKMTAPVLVDEEGLVGRAYGAKHTPHMFIVDAKGLLAYRGGLDNAPNGRIEGEGTEVVNYISSALAELKAGKAVTHRETKAYGCSVKYGKQKEKEKEKVKG
jgi:peroxiredoxin